MKLIRSILIIVSIISLVVLALASANLSSNYDNLNSSSRVVCNTTSSGGRCPTPQLQPDLTLVIVFAVLSGFTVGWLGHHYLCHKKAK